MPRSRVEARVARVKVVKRWAERRARERRAAMICETIVNQMAVRDIPEKEVEERERKIKALLDLVAVT